MSSMDKWVVFIDCAQADQVIFDSLEEAEKHFEHEVYWNPEMDIWMGKLIKTFRSSWDD